LLGATLLPLALLALPAAGRAAQHETAHHDAAQHGATQHGPTQHGGGQREAIQPGAAGPPTGIVVASLGGDLQQSEESGLFSAFRAQTGEAVRAQVWDGTLATLRSRAAEGKTGWDLVLIGEAALRVACREGLLVPEPMTRDPADQRPDSAGQQCGVADGHIDLLLAWDKSRVDNPPSWSDFWDVARRPGKRGLQRDPRGTLEIALMADGVAPGDIYRTLSTSDGVDRAFRKLDQLKPYIVWWNTPADAEQILESGGVLMTSAAAGEIAAANRDGHRSFGMQPNGSLAMDLGWAMPRQTDPGERRSAQQLIAFLAKASAPVDARTPADAKAPSGPGPYPAGTHPATTGATATPSDSTPAGSTPASPTTAAPTTAAPTTITPTTAANQPKATLQVDDAFWAEHLAALSQRFDRWLGGR